MKIKLIIIFIILSQSLNSQRLRNFSFQLGGGVNYYFNNLEIFKDYVEPINFSIYGKLMWNTRYRLSFGVESGYIQLYRLNDFSTSGQSTINMLVVPIHAAIEMKLTKHIFGGFTFGPSFFTNTISSVKGDQTTHTYSIADMSLSVGYRHLFKNNLYISAEIKHFYSSKLEDRNIAIPIAVGINF
jgi:hypothetical protein